MNCDFNFKLINPHKRSIRLLANGILLLNGLILLYFNYQQHQSNYFYLRISLILFLASIDIFSKRKDWLYHTFGVMLVFVAWLYFGYWWIGIIMIALSVFAELAVADKRICFENNSVYTTTIFGKTYSWAKFQNIVLKDGLLTLDFKNNKIVQTIIDNEIDLQVEANFNTYCKQKINP